MIDWFLHLFGFHKPCAITIIIGDRLYSNCVYCSKHIEQDANGAWWTGDERRS